MEAGRASLTALGAARLRAAHQVLDGGRIFRDPLALAILGADADAVVRADDGDPWRRRLRLFVAVRSRVAEDALAAAIEAGLAQLVILGAGLDTLAYRGSVDEALRIFEVDHPATQAWKRTRLAEAGIPLPNNLRFVPVDFERDSLGERLAAAGLDPQRAAFFAWLGVVPYLSESAVYETLREIGSRSGGADVVFDYASVTHAALAARTAAVGEPLVSFFRTDALHARLRSLGFATVEDLGPRAIVARFFPNHPVPASDHGGHVLHARTAALALS